jgi:NAD(P)-dependent dehydrogenase (short-subunit alcohol dehydrogenase family)
MGGFRGKVVVVTGAASGIGSAAAQQFASLGATVAAIDRDKCEETLERIQGAGGVALGIQADVGVEADVVSAIDQVMSTFGRLDFAFNNAGISGRPRIPFPDISLTRWQEIIRTNLDSVFLCMREEVRHMIKQGGGAIVNTASIAGILPRAGAPHYAASKHGVIGLTQSAAAELAEMGVRINAVCPGGTDTPMLRKSVGIDSDAAERWGSRRVAQPEDVAAAAVWLCSPESSFVSGTALPVDGANLFIGS